ncbi:hypothetical protein F5148DRAFT_901277 [Russula earlei]|uniref:Uncharacterized protein n=1 Tax=Russula earlei TaxID=71964 RepID=A0ACC0UMV9_9AGAM|nr:hypothetical protein F5148DRAFT_901277 [Russula earlei]
MDPIYLDGSSTSAPYDQIEIDDDEEDQLVSDVDESPQVPRAPDGGHTQSTATTNGKRKHQRKSGERVPGHTLLPATRLENILRADGESGPMSKEAQFALSIATEEFIKRFTRAGHERASSEKRSIVSYRDMATVAAQNSPLKFLEDVVPLPMPLSVALESRALKEKERIDEDPALSARPIPSPLPKPTVPVSAPLHPVSAATTPTTTTAATESPVPAAPSRAKNKSSTTNGRASGSRSKDKNKELSNGNVPSTPPPPPPPPTSEPERPRSRRSSRRSEPQGWVETVSMEQQPAQSHLHSGGAQQSQWQVTPSPPSRNTHTNAQPWLAGPASGFLEERVHVPEGPFGATGRTIYSQR